MDGPQLEDLTGFTARVQQYVRWMETRGFSPVTIHTRKPPLRTLVTWFTDNGITHPREVTRAILERYQGWVFSNRGVRGKGWSVATQLGLMTAVRALFKWMAAENFLLFNPAADLELPRQGYTLPKHVLTLEEMELVLQQPDLALPTGLRDRAMLETFFSTGIRRAELAQLRVGDLNVELGTLRIRGKGDKERMVPVTERALAWIARYILEALPFLLAADEECRLLFPSTKAKPITLNHVTVLMHNYIAAAGLTKGGACHVFRHTTATLMLENGADVRFIQELLGHEKLRTTQRYTHVSIRKLKEVHAATHPGERPQRATRKRAMRELSDDSTGKER